MIARRALLAAPLLLAAKPAPPQMAGAAPPQAAGAAPPQAARPIARADAWWQARHRAKLAELRAARPELIWLGDSITQNFERDGPEPWARFQPVWQRFYAPLRAVNLGFKGDATCHLLWRIENGELAGITPKVAIILIGANNLGRLHYRAEDSITGVAAVVAETRRRLPGARILLLSVLPSDRSDWASRTTLAINAGLAARFSAGDGVMWQDVSALFAPGGRLDHALFLDPLLSPPEPSLHPTAAGMERLARAIQPNVATLLRG